MTFVISSLCRESEVGGGGGREREREREREPNASLSCERNQ